jgi:hypothetical protein
VRFSSFAAAAMLAALVTLLSGCGGSPSASTAVPGVAGAPASTADVLKLQLAGRLPTFLPRTALLRALHILNANKHRPSVKRHAGNPGLWVSSLAYSYVVGLSPDAQHTVTAIDVGSNGCEDPYGIKVDHSNNLWVACAFNSSMSNGVVQEYKQGASTPAATFNDAGCSSPCTSFDASAQDVAFDASGHVFASNIDSNECVPYCTNNLYPVVWWPANSPNSLPTGIKDPNIIFSGGYLDVDANGSVYTSGYGCIGTACGYLLDKIVNPTSASPTVTNLVPPSFNYDLEGVYASKSGTVLSVTDGDSRTISEYHLNPWNATAFKKNGPTLTNIEGYGQPIAGGYTKDENTLVQGDAFGWVDVGKVDGNNNNWQTFTNPDINALNAGAAYVPSDK